MALRALMQIKKNPALAARSSSRLTTGAAVDEFLDRREASDTMLPLALLIGHPTAIETSLEINRACAGDDVPDAVGNPVSYR
ncbi:hypothetical protein SLT36_23665 [Aminobacter sp. BA135]|uniref:hypothetical protein n=1 Tax=Aminobacter sp. BA135 TaxID=537596 RepID=UPI003D79FB7B